MPDVVYCGQHHSPPSQLVQTVGTVFGPPLGDNWTQIATLPASAMPSGARPYVFLVHGAIGSTTLAGAAPQRGLIQLCLGTAGGSLHDRFRVSIPAGLPLSSTQGIPFQFLIFVNSTFGDSLLGTTLNPASTQLCLYARTFLNGDPQNYAVTFTVADVVWHWFDMSTIPSASVSMDQQSLIGSSFTLGSTVPVAFNRLSPSAFGSSGQDWLNFSNVWCTSRDWQNPAAANAPRFRFGNTPDGTYGSFVTRIGSSDRWGMQQAVTSDTGAMEQVHWQHGGFWVHSGAQQAGWSGYEPAAATIRTIVMRYRHFAMRLDQLPDVHFRTEPGPFTMGQSQTVVTWEAYNILKERPTPDPLIMHPTYPIVMVHAVARPPAVSSRPGFGARVIERTFDGASNGASSNFTASSPLRGEAMSSVGFLRRQFLTTSPPMQWLGVMIGGTNASTTPGTAYDYCFVAFHPVFDPSITTGPGAVPPPVYLVPSKQSADPASLSLPPFVPNAAVLERGDIERNQIAGATGYTRRWPMGARSMRLLTISWGPLSDTDAATLFAFLLDNIAWRFSPPRSHDLAVMTVTPPVMAPVSHRTVTISVDVVVLVWTGV